MPSGAGVPLEADRVDNTTQLRSGDFKIEKIQEHTHRVFLERLWCTQTSLALGSPRSRHPGSSSHVPNDVVGNRLDPKGWLTSADIADPRRSPMDAEPESLQKLLRTIH